MAGFNVVGMLLSGWLTDRVNRPMLLGGVYFIRALVFILLVYVGADISLLFLFAVIFGTLDFATVPPTAGIVATHLGVRTMGFSMGVLFAGHSVGAAAGAFLGGWFYDLYARYDGVWLLGLGLAMVAAVLSWSIREIPREDLGRAPAAAAA
jgi:predicted MFS family arabinose efflux permease